MAIFYIEVLTNVAPSGVYTFRNTSAPLSREVLQAGKPKSQGFPGLPFSFWVPIIMENQMEKKMENEMETGFI